MPLIQIGKLAGHQPGIRQTSRRIGFGEFGDCAGLFHRRDQAGRLQVRGAGAGLSLAKIDGQGNTAVARAFHGLHFTQANIHRQSSLFADRDFGLAGASQGGKPQHFPGQGPKSVCLGDRYRFGDVDAHAHTMRDNPKMMTADAWC